jgi:hypothetical protein
MYLGLFNFGMQFVIVNNGISSLVSNVNQNPDQHKITY